MGGDIEKIQVVGRYFIEVWKAAGMVFIKIIKYNRKPKMSNFYGHQRKYIKDLTIIGFKCLT